MHLPATAAILAVLLLAGCSSTTREKLTLGVAGPGKAASLAFQSRTTFGQALGRRDWARLAKAELRALDFTLGGKSLAWGQPSGRARGTVEVSQPFSIASRECRRFKHDIIVKGSRDSVRGVACRTGQGPWSLVS